MRGKVYITGAGPGDPALLTLKAHHIIGQADVILHDRLINKKILKLAPKRCEIIYVGKSDQMHILKQDQINKLLLQKARAGKKVVRLKGGDPFLFGRGAEEALYLAKKNIPFEVIPGVTSAIGVPELAGIPLTHRKMASSVAILTGHEAGNKKSTIDWPALGKIHTLVFLMGASHIGQIAGKLVKSGRSKNELVALIERGSTANEHVTVATLGGIIKHPPILKPPAIIVVGKVVRLREQLFSCKDGL